VNGAGARLPRRAGRGAASHTETFVALRAEIANWRWAGVPFYIRTGKRLAGRDAHIVVNFRPAPHAIFQTPQGAANRLVINLQPATGWNCTCWPRARTTRAPRPARRWRLCSWTWTSTSALAPSAWAPTSGCCWT
jgi:glucose-6-phosphate 1-dehydrogenase